MRSVSIAVGPSSLENRRFDVATPLWCHRGRRTLGFEIPFGPHEENTMTTLKDRPNTALLVIDVQNGVVAERPQPRRGHREHQHAGRQGPQRGRARHLGAALQRRSSASTARVGSTSRSWQRTRLRTAGAQAVRRLLRGHEPRRPARRARRRLASSSPARRPTPASARHCTAVSRAATT